MSEELSRRVELSCPTCGGLRFECDAEVDDPEAIVRCVLCDRRLTRGELLRENQANIDQHLTEVGDESVNSAAEELTRTLKNAFRGNKFIKFE